MLHAIVSLLLLLAPPAPAAAAPTDKALSLAELMREITVHAERVRPRVAAGKRLGALPSTFAGIHTAEVTSPKMKGEHFEAFAAAYLAAARQLHDRSDPEPKKDVYNHMVATCAACHTQYCPGPLARIQKLSVN